MLALLVLLPAAAAQAAPTAPLGHEGRWVTDAEGRVVMLHGVNMVYKRAPFYPSAAGFNAEDAAFLSDHGFNTVRLGITYAGVEPQPGVYDDDYLEQVAASEQLLAAHGIFSQLDFHQDMYNPRFQGNGFPDWAVQDDGLPAEPKLGFPNNYVGMLALNRAYDHFWANDPGPDGIGLQDHYAAAFKRVAQRFRTAQHTMGFDIMNEPWPGLAWPTCAVPVLGCPLFDSLTLAPFHQKVIQQVRSVEPQKLIWYEPNVIFNFGPDSNHPPTGDGQTGFSFHDYCLAGAFSIPGLPPIACETLDELVFDNADKQAAETGDALLLSEFGATNDLDVIRRTVDSADAHMVSWQYWHYCECDDPTTQGPGQQGLIGNANLPPSGANVNQAKLEILERPYPQTVAGTPQNFNFDRAEKRFTLGYTTTGPGGQSFEPTVLGDSVSADSPQTEIYVPASHYPSGYDVDVAGAAIASAPGARTLRLIACPNATIVAVVVSLPGEGSGIEPACEVATPDAGPGPGGGGEPGAGAGSAQTPSGGTEQAAAVSTGAGRRTTRRACGKRSKRAASIAARRGTRRCRGRKAPRR